MARLTEEENDIVEDKYGDEVYELHRQWGEALEAGQQPPAFLDYLADHARAKGWVPAQAPVHAPIPTPPMTQFSPGQAQGQIQNQAQASAEGTPKAKLKKRKRKSQPEGSFDASTSRKDAHKSSIRPSEAHHASSMPASGFELKQESFDASLTAFSPSSHRYESHVSPRLTPVHETLPRTYHNQPIQHKVKQNLPVRPAKLPKERHSVHAMPHNPLQPLQMNSMMQHNDYEQAHLADTNFEPALGPFRSELEHHQPEEPLAQESEESFAQQPGEYLAAVGLAQNATASQARRVHRPVRSLPGHHPSVQHSLPQSIPPPLPRPEAAKPRMQMTRMQQILARVPATAQRSHTVQVQPPPPPETTENKSPPASSVQPASRRKKSQVPGEESHRQSAGGAPEARSHLANQQMPRRVQANASSKTSFPSSQQGQKHALDMVEVSASKRSKSSHGSHGTTSDHQHEPVHHESSKKRRRKASSNAATERPEKRQLIGQDSEVTKAVDVGRRETLLKPGPSISRPDEQAAGQLLQRESPTLPHPLQLKHHNAISQPIRSSSSTETSKPKSKHSRKESAGKTADAPTTSALPLQPVSLDIASQSVRTPPSMEIERLKRKSSRKGSEDQTPRASSGKPHKAVLQTHRDDSQGVSAARKPIAVEEQQVEESPSRSPDVPEGRQKEVLKPHEDHDQGGPAAGKSSRGEEQRPEESPRQSQKVRTQGADESMLGDIVSNADDFLDIDSLLPIDAELELPVVEEPPVEEPPVEDPPVEEPPVEEPSVEEPLAAEDADPEVTGAGRRDDELDQDASFFARWEKELHNATVLPQTIKTKVEETIAELKASGKMKKVLEELGKGKECSRTEVQQGKSKFATCGATTHACLRCTRLRLPCLRGECGKPTVLPVHRSLRVGLSETDEGYWMVPEGVTIPPSYFKYV